MKTKILLLILLLPVCAFGQDLKMLVGTYTEGTPAKGIYLYSFQAETAASERLDMATAGNPSFVIPSPDGKYAFCVNEYNDGKQALSSFAIGDGSIREINSVPIPKKTVDGEDPCHLVLTGEALVSANYTGGTVTAFAVNTDGSISEMTQYFLGEKKSHMHCAVPSPDGKYLFVTDLGKDCVLRFDREDGIHPLGAATLAWKSWTAARFGPRHLVFSADGRFAYLLCELSDKLVVFSYDNGRLEPVQILLAYNGKGHGSADLHLSPDGRFLYTSHRLKGDGIGIFSVDPKNGTVTKAGFQPTGKHPRNFAITPDGRYLLCACRDDNRIEVYAIHPDSGALTPVPDKTIKVGAPVCIQFIP